MTRLLPAVVALDLQLAERIEQAEDHDPAAAQPLMWLRDRAVVFAERGDFDMLRRLAKIATDCAVMCADGKGPEPTLHSADHYQAIADIIEAWIDDQ